MKRSIEQFNRESFTFEEWKRNEELLTKDPKIRAILRKRSEKARVHAAERKAALMELVGEMVGELTGIRGLPGMVVERFVSAAAEQQLDRVIRRNPDNRALSQSLPMELGENNKKAISADWMSSAEPNVDAVKKLEELTDRRISEIREVRRRLYAEHQEAFRRGMTLMEYRAFKERESQLFNDMIRKQQFDMQMRQIQMQINDLKFKRFLRPRRCTCGCSDYLSS